MWFVRSFLILAGVIGFLWIGMENADQSIDFTFFTRDYPRLPLDVLMLFVFVAGMVFSFIISVLNELNLRRQLSQARRQLTRMDREIAALRSLPLEDADGADREGAL
ncbi:MAG TPA: LapA family protein [Candidatus Krumholzibacteria bacterium]|nr:LapA family protein [Candidatus Krumholzibacteria bacterium]